MIKVRDTELLQENIIGLISFARDNGFLELGDNSPSTFVNEFVQTFTKGCSGCLTLPELETLVKGTQAFLRLPVYTSGMAAAWLGVGIDTMRDAIWRSGKIKTIKPGHDVLITHGELVRFRDERRSGKE